MVTLRELKARVPKAGTIVGERYTLRTRLGRGGFGEVWAAADRERGHAVALKLLLQAGTPEALDQFRDEFRLLTTLNHPHINRVYDFGCDPVYGAWFSTERIHGADLATASQGRSPEQVEALIAQVLRALAFLHSRGVMHFDIKPHNILVEDAQSDAPRVKVIDFGLAALRPRATRAGTPGYMAPELIVPGAVIDGRADLYAVGVTLYACLARRNPFRADDDRTTWNNHLTFVPPVPSLWKPNIPAYLDTYIMRLLAKSPLDRPLTATHALHELALMSTCAHPVEAAATELAYLPAGGFLIGRQRERRVLHALVDAVARGTAASPSVVLLGPSGTGKTVLLQALHYEAQLAGGQVIAVQGPEDPALEHQLERLGHLLARPTERPTFVLIDDVDALCADPAQTVAVRLVRALLERVHHPALPRVGIVCSGRAVPEAWPALETLTVSPFTRDEVRDYLAAVVPAAGQQASLVEMVWRRTHGNPALVHETVRALIANGMCVDASGRWTESQFADITVDPGAIDVPVRLLREMDGLIDRLPETQRTVLTLLAIWDAPVSIAAVTALTDIPALPAQLRELIAPGLVQHDPRAQTYAVIDIVLRQAVLRGLPTPALAQWHDRIAAYRHARHDAAIAIDRHVAYGSDPAQRRAALARCCQWERRHGQLASAMRRLEERLAEEEPGAEDHELLLLLVRLFLQADRPDDAMRVLQQHAALGFHHADASVRAIAGDLAARAALRAGHPQSAREYYLHLHADADIMKDPCRRIRIENGLARVAFDAGYRDDALQRYRVQWAMQQQLPPAHRAQIENNELGQSLLQQGEVAAAVDQLRAEVALCEHAGQALPLASRLYHLGEALRQRRAYAEADGLLRRAARIARAQQALRLLATIYNGLGNVAVNQSDVSAATEWYERALPLTYRLGDLDRAIVLSVNLARLHAHGHHPQCAEHLLHVAHAYLDGHPACPEWVRMQRSAVYQLLGECARQRQAWDEALRYLEQAWAIAQEESVTAMLCSIALTRAEVEHARGALPAARDWCQRVGHCARTPEEDALYRTLLVNLAAIA